MVKIHYDIWKISFCFVCYQCKSHVYEIHYSKRKSTHLSDVYLKFYTFLLNCGLLSDAGHSFKDFSDYNYLILDTPVRKIQDNKRVQGKCINYSNVHM